jgi:hypothetical protein
MAGKSKSRLDPTITVAIIGLVGTIAAAYITIMGGRDEPTPTTQPPVVAATEIVTAPAVEASATVESAPPAADTPTATSVPLLAAGEDWDQGCISAIWQVYPPSADTTSENGCYVNLITSGFAAQDGALTFSLEERVDTRDVFGIFAEIPSNSLVNLKVNLKDLRTGEVWIGIFDQPDAESKGFVIAFQPGNVKDITFFALGLPTLESLYKSAKIPADSGNYPVSLDVTSNTVFGSVAQYLSTDEFSLSSAKKYLFLGYRKGIPGENRIEGAFFDLTIETR